MMDQSQKQMSFDNFCNLLGHIGYMVLGQTNFSPHGDGHKITRTEEAPKL